MTEDPTSTPREDPPTSGPYPEVQASGDSSQPVPADDEQPGAEDQRRFERLPVVFPICGQVKISSHSVQGGEEYGTRTHRLEYVETAF